MRASLGATGIPRPNWRAPRVWRNSRIRWHRARPMRPKRCARHRDDRCRASRSRGWSRRAERGQRRLRRRTAAPVTPGGAEAPSRPAKAAAATPGRACAKRRDPAPPRVDQGRRRRRRTRRRRRRRARRRLRRGAARRTHASRHHTRSRASATRRSSGDWCRAPRRSARCRSASRTPGLLFNGVQMPPGDAWTVVAPGEAWGTQETVDYLETAIHVVTAAISRITPKLAIGDISARNGGYLTPSPESPGGPRRGHQLLLPDGQRLVPARRRRATWTSREPGPSCARSSRAPTSSSSSSITRSRSCSAPRRSASARTRSGSTHCFAASGALPPIIRHAPGHATHLHIRFYSPIAAETGRRAYAALLRHQHDPRGARVRRSRREEG